MESIKLCGNRQRTYLVPFVDGIGYWNEDMPAFSNNLNALSPYGDTGSELIQDYNLIGWSQDVNGNGQLDLLTGYADSYYVRIIESCHKL